MAKDMEDKPHLIASGVLHGDVQKTFFFVLVLQFLWKTSNLDSPFFTSYF